MISTENVYQQMVMSELKNLIVEQKPIRVSFAPNTETNRQLNFLSVETGSEARQLIEVAVRVFYVAYMRSNYVKPND